MDIAVRREGAHGRWARVVRTSARGGAAHRGRGGEHVVGDRRGHLARPPPHVPRPPGAHGGLFAECEACAARIRRAQPRGGLLPGHELRVCRYSDGRAGGGARILGVVLPRRGGARRPLRSVYDRTQGGPTSRRATRRAGVTQSLGTPPLAIALSLVRHLAVVPLPLPQLAALRDGVPCVGPGILPPSVLDVQNLTSAGRSDGSELSSRRIRPGPRCLHHARSAEPRIRRRPVACHLRPALLGNHQRRHRGLQARVEAHDHGGASSQTAGARDA
mmetsp:Transcript_17903/g.42819  ORF Transcript_17903/g.42819 Transcript_17903/m.42819 type:complete len:274 (-) Transcript_17903:2432-3253(-)